MSPDVLVGLDVGTTGVKAVAISPEGRVLATASESYPLATPRPGWSEQNPEDWWRAAQACLARLPDGAVGLSGQMHGLVVLDAEGRVLRPAILWNDQQTAAKHGIKIFLEHKNSEPAMKILMRNVGMTLHVIHKLRARGISNVQVNMDWQHLLMNGESLAEYAALLAAEGLLGHQHANSGWGTFDDDNMVGATAFMETLELAVELRRAHYGENGERLGFDLYPYTEDAVGAVKRSVLHWRFIDEVAGRIEGDSLRQAQQEKDAVRAYELVYAALGA